MTYDHKEAMRDNRKQWADVDVTTISAMVPQIHRTYFSAQAKVITAKYLLDKVDNGDTEVHEMFGNRMPRLSFRTEEAYKLLAEVSKESSDTELKKRVEELAHGLEMRDSERLLYEQGLQERDHVKMFYHGAREYAIVYGLAGQWTLISLLRDGYEPPRLRGW